MSIVSSIFSIPFLLSLAIMLLVVGFVSIFFIQRLREQNHKIAAMLDLVAALADQVAQTRRQPTDPSTKRVQMDKLIEVSDGEESIEEDSSEDDMSEGKSDSDSEDEGEDEECDNNVSRDICSIFDFTCSKYDTEDEKFDDLTDTIDIDSAPSTEIRVIHLSSPNVTELDDVSLPGDILIKTDDIEAYRKLSIQKLRIIATEKIPLLDTAKLKKNEIISALGNAFKNHEV